MVYGGYARARIAVAVRAGQNRLFGWAGEPLARKRSANCRRLCHPDGIAAGPRSPVEGPGRRGPSSRDAHQSKGLVTSVPGEPPRDGRGHRRRVGTAATPAIRTDVDPVAGAPAPASSLSSCSSCRLPPASHDARPPEPHDAASADSRARCLPSPAPTSRARGARRAPAPGSGPHRPRVLGHREPRSGLATGAAFQAQGCRPHTEVMVTRISTLVPIR